MRKFLSLFTILMLAGVSNSFGQQMLTIDRDSFLLKYPANWTIDKEDEDYDPDALFSLDSPEEGGSIMFMKFSMVIDADDMLEAQVEEMKKGLVKKPDSITDFDSWGNYKGKGKIIKGKIIGIFKGYIKLFIHTDDNKSMLVMEQLYDTDAAKLGPAFKSIADSFVFK